MNVHYTSLYKDAARSVPFFSVHTPADHTLDFNFNSFLRANFKIRNFTSVTRIFSEKKRMSLFGTFAFNFLLWKFCDAHEYSNHDISVRARGVKS